MESNLTNVHNNWVYQSNRLIEASYTLTVLEQKILRLLASMVKKEDNDFNEYRFNTKDLMKMLNTTNKRFYKDIDQLTDLLMQRIIKIQNIDTKEFEKYHWVDVANYKNGVLTLKISKELKPFYLNLDWYTKYQLKNIMQFKSTYSFRFYELLKQYLGIKERVITIDDLRFKLYIPQNQYPKYANLKSRVIKPAINEINRNTDLYINFEEVKTGRKVTSIKFYIHSKNKAAAIDEIAVTSDIEENNIKKVQNIIQEHITALEAKKIIDAASGDLEKIKEKYSMTKDINSIKNIVAWIIKAIKEDWQPGKGKFKTSDFKGRNYTKKDIKEIEKGLLGYE
jgi:plasmid replication initiation protein